MPIFSNGGAMTIVAHQDDDILFMNPDIDASIAAGVPNITVYVTAGDAGLGADYWAGREAGAKAAYSVMTGIDRWVDEVVQVVSGDTAFQIASSHPEGNTDLRLYFLRLPDGGGDLPPELEQQLAQLEGGTLEHVTTVDGASTYGRQDVVNVLQGIIELHSPLIFRMQIHEGDNAMGEHTDHINTSEFADEALEAYSGTDYMVDRYVNYASSQQPANLSAEDAARALQIMQAYAEHDPAVMDPTNGLQQVYVDWTMRQYIDSREIISSADRDDSLSDDPFVSDDPADPVDGSAANPDLDLGGARFSLAGPDAFLFRINAATGNITQQDWFTPSLGDAWDQNEDHVYEVTRIASFDDGRAPVSKAVVYETAAEGLLSEVQSASEGPGSPAVPDDQVLPEDPVIAEGPSVPDETPDGPTPAGPTDQDLVYRLTGPDAQLFDIDNDTGDVSLKDWFQPSRDDAWDRNEDHLYEITRTGTAPDGTIAQTDNLRFETLPDGSFVPLTEGQELMRLLALASDEDAPEETPEDFDEDMLEDA